MLALRRLLWLALAAATVCTAAAVVHDEAQIFSVNGTFNTHFSARITDLQPDACVIFEAQVCNIQESFAGDRAYHLTIQEIVVPSACCPRSLLYQDGAGMPQLPTPDVGGHFCDQSGESSC